MSSAAKNGNGNGNGQNNDNRNLITVLDVGSAKTVALICQATDSGLRYRGHAVVDGRATSWRPAEARHTGL